MHEAREIGTFQSHEKSHILLNRVADIISDGSNDHMNLDINFTFTHIALYLANLYFLYCVISNISKLLFWRDVIGIIEDIDYKSSGEYISLIPTISYAYENKSYTAKPVGPYAADGFLKDMPIKIFVNPKNPGKFSINSWNNVLAHLFILGIINIPSITILTNALF